MEAQGLDVQDKLEYARCAVAVLRALKIHNAKMTYGDFARAIGLIRGGGVWQVWHRQQISDVLCIVAAVERFNSPHNAEPLEFERIVTEATGQSGEGVFKTSRIVRD